MKQRRGGVVTAAVLSLAMVLGAGRLTGAGEEAQTTINLNVAAVPETTGLPATLEEIRAEENRYAWDRFAWQTFIALNWPAIEPSPKNGYLRGFPDLSDPTNINFVHAGSYGGPVVWETFFEKREMFDADAKTADDARPAPWSSFFSRRVYGSAKFTTLDETVEVLAEALEEYDGFHSGMPVAPRVFRGTTADDAHAVRYEVKVNYDFYKYVVDNGLYFDPAAEARSEQQPPVQLPWRTSLSAPGVRFLTQKPAETSYVEGYRVASTLAAYQAGAEAAAQGHEGVLPPRIGAVHLKAAWAPIENEEKDRFLWRAAEYFTGMDRETETGLFGLVGLHIIQRIKVQAPENLLNNQALGGTFIYSTWEHKDIKETPGGTGTQYTYTNYFENPADPKAFYADPKTSDPFYVYRLYPILDHTQEFNQAVWAAVGEDSVWSNYRLVGTQFVPVNIENDGPITSNYPGPNDVPQPDLTTNPNDPTGIGQPVYLSNLVIETNLGLQQFQGQPPGLNPVAQFAASVSKNDTSHFFRTRKDAPGQPHSFGNLRFGNSRTYQETPKEEMSSAYNMGGCMGCHGVAQLNGFSFSFVLLGGQAGADPDAEGVFFEAPISSEVVKHIPLLRAGQQLQLQPFRAPAGTYLANQGGKAVVTGTMPRALILQPADGRVAGSPFRFGDGVTLQDADGNYLTAKAPLPSGPSPVVFTETMTPASVWYLEDPLDPGSTGDVLRLEDLSFLNAAVTYPNEDLPRLPLPALLSTYPKSPEGSVTTMAQLGVRERWNAVQ